MQAGAPITSWKYRVIMMREAQVTSSFEAI